MRKPKLILAILILTLAVTACLFSCKETIKPSFSLSFNGATLSWEEVRGASYYTVNCFFPDGSGYSVSTKKTDYACPQSESGDYVYSVSAKGKNGKTVALSENKLYHLGKGSHLDPILISGADELASVFTGTYDLTFGNSKVSAPLYYRLTADVDLAGLDWTPIGTSTYPFAGVFDGNGHSIKNLTLTKCNTDAKVGLFGSVKTAVIKNLTIEGANLSFDKNSGVKGNSINLGFLCGYALSSVIDNCRVTGNINVLKGIVTTGSVNMYVGGIVGQMASGKFFNNSFSGSVFAQYSAVFAGGLIGYATNASPRFVMTNCLSEATVAGVATGYNVTTQASTAIARVGVIAGSIAGSERIASCLAIGSSSAETTRDGTAESSVSSGVFGNTAGSSGVNSVPIHNLFYSADTLSRVSGTRSSIGSAYSAYGLTDDELKNKDSYFVSSSYALSFGDVWEIEDGYPFLKGIAASADPLPQTISITGKTGEKTDYDYTLSLEQTFNPSYFALSVQGKTAYYFGYHLNTILNAVGASLTNAENVTIEIGEREIRTFTVQQASFSSTYLTYGYFPSYERKAELLPSYEIIDAGSLTVYDDLSEGEIKITITYDETAVNEAEE